MSENITALIVDDESLARANIRYSLSEVENWDVVGECARGDEVIVDVINKKPNVVFLDIKMPGLDGLKVCKQLQALEQPPIVVFVTAFDMHAVEAFEMCALDYLLKPFDDERFNATIARVEKQLIQAVPQRAQIEQLEQVSGAPTHLLEKLIVRSVGKIQFVEVAEVNWISSAGNYVELHLADTTILHRVSLSFLEKHLPSEDFCRVHRTSLVRVSQITEFQTLADGQYAVTLKSGEQVSVSQGYKEKLLAELGID